MTLTTTMAIPTDAPGGLDAALGSHFGKAPCFTMVRIHDGVLASVSVLPQNPHETQGCMGPVRYLAEHGAKFVIAEGMGRRPLLAFHSMGMVVVASEGARTVQEAVTKALKGELRVFTADQACNHNH